MLSLGFDASTTTVGYAYTQDGVILCASFVDVSKYESNREKANAVINVLKLNPLTEGVERVNLEGSLSGFSGPANRAVVVKLARWNAIFEFVLEDFFKQKVNLINPSSARKNVFGKAKIEGVPPKDFVKSMIDRSYDMTPWTVLNKLKNPDKRMEDVYDALVISLYDPLKNDKARSNRGSKKAQSSG